MSYIIISVYIIETIFFSMIIYLGYNLPRFWEVTWVETYSPILDRNITEVVPTKLRLNQIYIEVSCLEL